MHGSIAIIGAGGVGTAIAYASLIRGVGRRIALFDLDDAKAEAEVLDLNHGLRFADTTATVAGGSDLTVCAGADVVVITAGAKQRPGESRLDLAARNADILRSLVPDVMEVAPDAILLLVTNPVDVLTYGAIGLSGLPAGRVIGSGTVLDTSRLHYLLAQRCNVDVRNIHAYVAGEHGDSEFPLWSSATVGGVPIEAWQDDGGSLSADELSTIAHDVTTAAYRIIAGKGATTYAIGLATTEILAAILSDAHRILPVSSLYEDVALSLPTVVGREGVLRVLDVPMSDAERTALAASRQAIRSVIESVGFS